jgi:hypothetical protein
VIKNNLNCLVVYWRKNANFTFTMPKYLARKSKKIWPFLGLKKRVFGSFKQFLRNFDLNQKANLREKGYST